MYIVTWKPETSQSEIKSKADNLASTLFSTFSIQNEQQSEYSPINLDIGTFKATCSYLTEDLRQELQKDSAVLSVEENKPIAYTARQFIEQGILYNLDVLDGVQDGFYNYPDTAGTGTDIYILDTGVTTQHREFNGTRAQMLGAIGIQVPMEDPIGHGSHVAGIAAGSMVGVSKNSTILMIRLLDETGGTSTAAVLQGIEMVIRTAQQRQRPSVINMSFAGPASDALDAAVRQLTAAGIVAVVAAGNEGQDACNLSPAREPSVITVGASGPNNEFAPFSNVGRCVDIVAPGFQIASASNQGMSEYEARSGTSMSSPMVAGVAAVFLSQGTPAAQVRDAMVNGALANITGNLQGTPNALASIRTLLNGGGQPPVNTPPSPPAPNPPPQPGAPPAPNPSMPSPPPPPAGTPPAPSQPVAPPAPNPSMPPAPSPPAAAPLNPPPAA
ncbi:peptidase S8/S53 domain-containing protein [Paraphysoderma sedebokerense]|nr:peptidase S8/S53 domain-containing protein [Paraphysoderma sedebokerense]